jgi:DNA-binding MarR family transcriptional regulator
MGEKDAALTQGLAEGLADRAPTLTAGLGEALYQGFCFPGTYLLEHLFVRAPAVVRFAGLPVDPHHPLTIGVAAMAWIAAIIALVSIYRVARETYFTVLGYAGRLHQGYLRFGRKAARRSTLAVHRPARQRNGQVVEPTISEEVHLGELEYAVLHVQADAGRNGALSASDIAESLNVRMSQAKRSIEILLMLQLLAIATRPGRREPVYRLTPHGEGFLAACTGTAAGPATA